MEREKIARELVQLAKSLVSRSKVSGSILDKKWPQMSLGEAQRSDERRLLEKILDDAGVDESNFIIPNVLTKNGTLRQVIGYYAGRGDIYGDVDEIFDRIEKSRYSRQASMKVSRFEGGQYPNAKDLKKMSETLGYLTSNYDVAQKWETLDSSAMRDAKEAHRALGRAQNSVWDALQAVSKFEKQYGDVTDLSPNRRASAKSRSASLKSNLQKQVQSLIDKYDMDFGGEPLDADIYRLKYLPDRKTVEVIFNDENMGYFIAGYVSSSIYDKFERIIEGLGYEIYDTDGSRMLLEKI